MSAYGDSRIALRTPAFRRAMPVASEPMASRARVRMLRGSGVDAIVMRGAVSGRSYLFGLQGSTLDVDRRDVDALLASGWFQRV